MDIVNIDKSFNFKEENVTFVNGLTIDRVRMRYNWLLNACVKNAIIGEDAYGLVWYFGDWLCGEWLGGTWYSGRFIDGVWYNGFFHSCKLNKFDILNNTLTILEYNNTSSQFFNGVWENGDFYEGTFGEDVDLRWDDDFSNNVAIWKYGRFHSGLFYDAKWYNGIFYSGYMKNSNWFNGEFYSGVFDGGNSLNEKSNWFKGTFLGGDFIRGIWRNGLFTKLTPMTISRFGYTTKYNIDECVWLNGTFKSADFYSGSGCTNHGVSRWFNGTFEDGLWHGGSFLYGNWLNGVWSDGIMGTNSTPWTNASVIIQTGTSISWNDIENLAYSTTPTPYPAYISYSNTTTEGFISGNTLLLSGFSFGFYDLGLTDIDIKGIEVKIERSGYYDHFNGGLIDLQINIGNSSFLTGISYKENVVPYSYNNSYDREVIFYGNRYDDWNVTFPPFNVTTIDNLTLTYTPNIKYYPNIAITGYTYDISVKVYYSTTPIWYDGTWYNGVWYSGTFKHGIFKNGMIFGGTFEDVDMS